MPYDPYTNPLGYQEGETAEREFSMLERAIYDIADQVPDTLDLDYNGDGNVDNVVFVIKGEPGEWASLLWPHRWCIFDREVMLNGLRVYDFNLQLEIGDYFNVSTLCHEMNHSLGAPDLYHYSTGIDAVGSWDLMCSNASPPQHMGTYMKYKYGNWIDEIPEITEYGTYELEADSWEGNRRNAYRIASSDRNQFYIIEHRDNTRLFDESLPGGGLLIYRIDTRFNGNAGYDGIDIFDEVYIFRPNGNISNPGELNRAAYSANHNHTEFNYMTNPAPFFTNGQVDDQFCIYNISSRGDRMSFTYGPVNHEAIPQNLITHVDAQNHQVVLKWNPVVEAESYVVYRDGVLSADSITETHYSQAYTSNDNGYHTYRVSAVVDGNELGLSESQWVILGNYENLRLSIDADSPYGTKGGELEVAFDNGMPSQYLTIYEGEHAEAEHLVPANTVVTISWTAGFDPESEGIHVNARCSNQNGETVIIDAERPQAGVLTTYTVADNGLGLIAPQHVSATSDGQRIQLNWTIPTENLSFDIYRGNKKIKAAFEGYDYLDDNIMRSGTYSYHVETALNGVSTWNLDQIVYSNVMNYYCEPPQNLEGSYHDNGHINLNWEAPEFFGYGLLAYDDNQFIEQFGTNSAKWGIKIEPEILTYFDGHPLTHIELFDGSSGHYTFTIYNGEVTNNSTTLYVQAHDMEGSQEFVRFALDEPVAFDPTLPLWICVSSSNTQHPIPCCEYVGEDNSCLVKSGTVWKPALEFGINRSWLLRGYTSPIESSGDFTYNVYWGPEEGGDEQLDLGYEALTATQTNYRTTENLRYNVTAMWDGRETDLSNTIYLGPSVGIEEAAAQGNACDVFPNPVRDHLTLQGDGIQYVRLVTVTGACVYESQLKHNEVNIDMTSLPQGLYFLSVRTEKGTNFIKVVKQ